MAAFDPKPSFGGSGGYGKMGQFEAKFNTLAYSGE
jgi:hypothetical protein